MTEVLTPPEGQNSFSGIPEAQFIEDVDSHMKGENSAEDQLKVSRVWKIKRLAVSCSSRINQYLFGPITIILGL